MDQEIVKIVKNINIEKMDRYNDLQFEEMKRQTLEEEKRRKIYFGLIDSNIKDIEEQGKKGLDKIIRN